MKSQLFLMAAYSSAYSERCQEVLLSYSPVLSRQDQLLIYNRLFQNNLCYEASYFISTFKLKKRLSFCVLGFWEHLQANHRFSRITSIPMTISDYVELDGYSASLTSCHMVFFNRWKVAASLELYQFIPQWMEIGCPCKFFLSMCQGRTDKQSLLLWWW